MTDQDLRIMNLIYWYFWGDTAGDYELSKKTLSTTSGLDRVNRYKAVRTESVMVAPIGEDFSLAEMDCYGQISQWQRVGTKGNPDDYSKSMPRVSDTTGQRCLSQLLISSQNGRPPRIKTCP